MSELRAMMADYNPRTIDPESAANLELGLEAFGCVLPIVVNRRTKKVVGGHQRISVAEGAGLATLPVRFIDVDELTEKRLNLALNKIDGEWDYELLEKALQSAAEADVLILTGFTEDDLADFGGGTEDFAGFSGRFGENYGADSMIFRSRDVTFTCPKAEYDGLVQRIYGEVGMDDRRAAEHFFGMIGLYQKEAPVHV